MSNAGLAKTLFKILVASEVAGVFAAYYFYYKMDTSQEFRNRINKETPSILEVYYKCNEMAGVYGKRERDIQAWSTRAD